MFWSLRRILVERTIEVSLCGLLRMHIKRIRNGIIIMVVAAILETPVPVFRKLELAHVHFFGQISRKLTRSFQL